MAAPRRSVADPSCRRPFPPARAGYAGLNLLVDLHPDPIELDIGLCRGIDRSRLRRAIVHGVMVTCRDLEIGVVAEGVETPGELAALRNLGVRYFQGFLFARPAGFPAWGAFSSVPAVRAGGRPYAAALAPLARRRGTARAP